MAAIKSLPKIIEDLTRYSRAERDGIFTMNWEQFSRHVDRLQFKEAFLDNVRKGLKEKDVLIAYGKHVVVVINDHHFKK